MLLVAKALFGAVHSHAVGTAVMVCTGFGCSHVIVLVEMMLEWSFVGLLVAAEMVSVEC